MKRLLWILMPLFGLVVRGFAFDVYQSTNTMPNVSFLMLCGEGKRGFLHGVCTDFLVAGSSMTVYNSSWTTSNVKVLGPIGTTTENCRYYDTDMPGGISYRKTNAATVSILYRCQ